MTERPRTCSRCGAVSVASAETCDCGHSFASGRTTAQPKGRGRWHRHLVVGCGLLTLGCGAWFAYTLYSTFVAPGRTFRAMHAAVRPGMTRLEALKTLADVRAEASFQTIFVPDQGPSPEVEPLFWTFGRRPSASEIKELDTKLAPARQFRVIASAPFSHMEFVLTVSDDGRVERVGERSGSAK